MSGPIYEVPAVVFAALTPSTIELVLHPGAGQADGGVRRSISLELVPPALRTPNTALTVTMERGRIVRVQPR